LLPVYVGSFLQYAVQHRLRGRGCTGVIQVGLERPVISRAISLA